MSTESREVGRVAYLMSRFPKLSETFVLYEILAIEDLGMNVEIFPLMRQREEVVHPDAVRLTRRAHYLPFISPGIVAANLRSLVNRPRTYLTTLWATVTGTLASPRFLLRALALFPKAVRFAEEAERRGVQHLHAHFATHPAVAAYIIHRLTGIPFSFTAHGSDLHVDRTMLRQKVDAAEFVVAISMFNKRMIESECPGSEDRISVIHCGVDCDVINWASAVGGDTESLQPPDQGLDPEGSASATSATGDAAADPQRDVVVLCVASLEPVKGHRHLIAACRELLDRGVRMRCLLAGDGPARDEILDQIATLGLEQHVRLLGPQPRPEILRLLSAADVFALTSHPTPRGQREGIPVAIMEAMAARLPVVSTNTGGIPELVRDGASGFVVEPGDVEAVANSLQALAESGELRARYGAEGRAIVESQFNLRANAQKLALRFAPEKQMERPDLAAGEPKHGPSSRTVARRVG